MFFFSPNFRSESFTTERANILLTIYLLATNFIFISTHSNQRHSSADSNFSCRIFGKFTIHSIRELYFFTKFQNIISKLWSFFYRPVVSVLLVLIPIYSLVSNGLSCVVLFRIYSNNFCVSADSRAFFSSNKKWILTNFALSAFPLLPIVGKSDRNSSEIL